MPAAAVAEKVVALRLVVVLAEVAIQTVQMLERQPMPVVVVVQLIQITVAVVVVQQVAVLMEVVLIRRIVIFLVVIVP